MSLYKVNGKNYIVNDINDAMYVIQKECGYEIAEMTKRFVDDLAEKADYISQKIGTDLDSYESSLEEYSSMCCEVNEINQKLMDYIEDTKKMDRHYILERLKDIEYEVNIVG